MTGEPLTVVLTDIEPSHGVQFLLAEIWDGQDRFAVVTAQGPDSFKTRLRMDVYKQIFLDHVNDEEIDSAIQNKAAEVWVIVANALRAHNGWPLPSAETA